MPGSATLMGSTEPRLSTPPARKLTRRTTRGYEAVQFAEDILGVELLPWQKWWLLHALELDENGDYRFRTIVTLVGRQSGKTTLLCVVALWSMYMGHARLVLGAAQALDIAKEAWQSAVERAQSDPELAAEVAKVRETNGDNELRLLNGARYRIAASTGSAGRGLSVDLLILDELRQHRDWKAWAALSKTTLARPCALTVCISNAGDAESVVLNALRERALAGVDDRLSIFEWSAPDGCDLDDPKAWAAGSPGLGRTISVSAISTALATDPPAVFRTEVLCQKVDHLDGAIDLAAWRDGADPEGSLEHVRDQLVTCVDVAPDGQHVALLGAVPLDDGRVRVEVFGAWRNTDDASQELDELLDQLDARAEAWFPSGPAAVLAPVMRRRANAVEIKGAQVPEACQTFADLVASRRVIHPADPLLDAHAAGASKLNVGDGWRFIRRGAGHVNAIYAAAGATHVALTVPVEAPMPRPMIV